MQNKEIQRPDEAYYVGRSRADRLLDGLYNSTKKKQHKSLQLTEYSNLSPKRQKIQNPKAEIKEDIPTQKVPVSKSIDQALDEILNKHLKKPLKYPKSVKIVNSLIQSGHMNHSNSNFFFHVIYEIFISDYAINLEEGRKEVQKLFSEGIKYYIDHHTTIEKDSNKEEIKFHQAREMFNNKDKIALLSLLDTRIFHLKLFTDDTYQFNTAINHFRSILSELSDKLILSKTSDQGSTNNIEHEKSTIDPGLLKIEASNCQMASIDSNENSEQDHSSNPSQLHNWNLPNTSDSLNLKLQFLYDALSTIHSYHQKYLWAQAPVEEFFQQVYLKRSIFSTAQQNQISIWQAALKSSSSSRKQKESTTLSIGEALNPVRDGREERISTLHGSAIWSAKQSGL